MSPSDFTEEEREILIVALNNMTEVILEVDKHRGADASKIAVALKEIDYLKDKIANANKEI